MTFATLRAAHDYLAAHGYSMVSPRLWTTGTNAAVITLSEHSDTVVVRFEELK